MSSKRTPFTRLAARIGCALLAALLLELLAAPAGADVQVSNRKDTVVLKDGTRIECIVVMSTPRGLLVIIQNPEKEDETHQEFIAAETVKEVIRGQTDAQDTMKGFKTETVETQKIVQGEGFRKAASKKKKKGGETGPVLPTGKIGPAEPLVETGLKTVPVGLQPLANTKLSPKEIVDAYMQRFPELDQAAEYFLGGNAKAEALIKKATSGDVGTSDYLKALLKPLLEDVEATPKAPTP
ncbi:MAG: hypothetical protein L6R28_23910 [Planctomycetes bacterium]|nr:hypothetical protein [Planctomycetota bacterium]